MSERGIAYMHSCAVVTVILLIGGTKYDLGISHSIRCTGRIIKSNVFTIHHQYLQPLIQTAIRSQPIQISSIKCHKRVSATEWIVVRIHSRDSSDCRGKRWHICRHGGYDGRRSQGWYCARGRRSGHRSEGRSTTGYWIGARCTGDVTHFHPRILFITKVTIRSRTKQQITSIRGDCHGRSRRSDTRYVETIHYFSDNPLVLGTVLTEPIQIHTVEILIRRR